MLIAETCPQLIELLQVSLQGEGRGEMEGDHPIIKHIGWGCTFLGWRIFFNFFIGSLWEGTDHVKCIQIVPIY